MKNWNIHIRLSCLALAIIMLYSMTGCTKTDKDAEPTTFEVTETTEICAVIVPETAVATKADEEVSHSENEDDPPEATVEAETTKDTTEPTEHTHKYDGVEKAEAGCDTDGYIVYLCSCGDQYTKVVYARGYHDWSAWETVKDATTETEGLMRRTCPDCGKTEEKAIAKLPAQTEPAVTEPPATEPTTCQHSWQTVHHPEEGHYENYAVCQCGYMCLSTADWIVHCRSYSAEDALLHHSGYGTSSKYIVDSPEYTEWVCSKCGAATTTQP